mgnify:CR=1 FL=1
MAQRHLCRQQKNSRHLDRTQDYRHVYRQVGLNVNQEHFLSDAPNPISLFQLISHPLPLQQALEELLSCIDARYAAIHDYATLEKEFLHHLYRGTGIHQWEDARGRFRASIAGMDEYGQLRLLDEAGCERLYAFKEVTYL